MKKKIRVGAFDYVDEDGRSSKPIATWRMLFPQTREEPGEWELMYVDGMDVTTCPQRLWEAAESEDYFIEPE